MTNELHVYTSTGLTLYSVLLTSIGRVWNGSTFVAVNSANWVSYSIPMSEATAGIYLASMPSPTPGTYGYVIYEQSGVTPATTDAIKGFGSLAWDGNTVITPLTSQGVRDAGKLAPSAGASVAGSIDAHLDAIQAITDDIDVSEVVYVPTNNAGTVTITIGRTFSATVSGLVIPADWETAFWTLKQNVNDDDPEALVRVIVTNPGDEDIDGLRCLNAVVWHEAVEDDEETDEDETDPEPFDRELASLTVDQPGGRVIIYLQDDLTTQLSVAKRIGWDVKFIDAAGDSTGTRGLANLVRTETQTV